MPKCIKILLKFVGHAKNAAELIRTRCTT